MNKIFNKTYSIKLPSRRSDESATTKKGILCCLKCNNVYFKKRWLSSLKEVERRSKMKATISGKGLCPACKMKESGLFEGELFIDNFPKEETEKLLRLISNFSNTAIEIDPQDRVLSIDKTVRGYRIITTENHLVNRMAKKIKDAYKNVEIHFSYSQEPFKVNRVHVTYL